MMAAAMIAALRAKVAMTHGFLFLIRLLDSKVESSNMADLEADVNDSHSLDTGADQNVPEHLIPLKPAQRKRPQPISEQPYTCKTCCVKSAFVNRFRDRIQIYPRPRLAAGKVRVVPFVARQS